MKQKVRMNVRMHDRVEYRMMKEEWERIRRGQRRGPVFTINQTSVVTAVLNKQENKKRI